MSPEQTKDAGPKNYFLGLIVTELSPRLIKKINRPQTINTLTLTLGPVLPRTN